LKVKPSRSALWIASLFTCIGIFLLFSMLFALLNNMMRTPVTNIFLGPGAFLLSSFFLAAFYVPCFLFAGSVILVKRPFKVRRLTLLILSIVPFLTFSLFLHVIFMNKVTGSSPALFVRQILGKEAGGIVLFVLFGIELYLLLLYAQSAGVKKQKHTISMRNEEISHLIYVDYDKDENINKREAVLNIHRLYKKQKEKEKNKDKDSGHTDPGRVCRNVTGIQLAFPVHKTRKERKAFLSLPEPEKRNSEEYHFPGLVYLSDEKNNEQGFSVEHPEDTFPGNTDKVSGNQTKDTFHISSLLKEEIEDTEVLEVNEAGNKTQNETGEADSGTISKEDQNQEETKDDVLLQHSLKAGKKKRRRGPYTIPVEGILKDYEDSNYWSVDDETRDAGDILMNTLKEFKITAEVTGIRKGPVITMFEILPAPGVKLSKIVNLADNIALRLAASRVRIVAPIPGKHAVGIEVPNKKRAIVSFKEMVSLDMFKSKKYIIPVIVGKDIAGEAQIIDLVQTPHLLIAGATGSGKSVCVNSIICSILYRKPPEDVKLLLIDPKIVELKFYNDIPHLLTPVITNPQKAFQALQYCLCEMERRYSLLDALGVRDIQSFNNKVKTKKLTVSKLPYIVIIIDEFADLIANTGKEMEQTIARLAAMSRAVGLHLVLATQRPSVEVITGLIKANIPSRIAFMVASKFDSRIIIDCVGAEKLLGKGDMLITAAWDPFPVRIQGSFLSEEEVERLVEYVKTFGEPDYIDDEIFIDDEDEESVQLGEADPLMEQALEVIVAKGKASASYLQRRLKIGYNRAARIVEDLEMRGIVGPPNGSKPRELLHIPDKK
jgi:DNA segregation ATPase FtsK/SpoIIIE, S-DNA-T family